MNLIGNAVGLKELKIIKEERKDFLRFLITEAKTSFGRSATFKGSDGRTWLLRYHGQRNELEVQLNEEEPERL
ncbi:MAG: hypothetical protein JRJ87_15225 [Deltaproteobacteria bacterium]|nr:hypothetical protein [Deltaproteobacteria bacterium]